ncbi:S8 family peptidase [Arthrobacter rhombi]|uniref:S8 family peptidase n=1 Tax=Arthrobacter rhombi TaxID=71253 RepID=UPI003FD217CF
MGKKPIRLTRAVVLSTAAFVGSCSLIGGLTGLPATAATPTAGPAVSSTIEVAADSNTARAATGALEAGTSYDQFIVSYKDSARSATKQDRVRSMGPAAQEAGVTVKEVRPTATGGHVVKTNEKLSTSEAKQFMLDAAQTGSVESIEPDAMMTIAATPNDSRYGEQWDFHGSNGMRTPNAWNYSTGSGSVVAVLDTGITNHSDLNANVLSGYDFVSDASAARDGNGRDSNPADEGDWVNPGECGSSYGSNSSWHGTHVAGTVAAMTDNSKGVAGVAPTAKVVPVRVLARCGGSLSDISDAIVWASGGNVSGVPSNPNPADVINMSLGGGGACGYTYQNAINSAVSRGTSVVVAAGNESQNAANSRPANCNNVITVGASNKSGSRAFYSNYGAAVDVTAPGGDTSTRGGGILSTINSGRTTPSGEAYAEFQGTSMAAPHVAGVVALMRANNPNMSPSSVESSLKSGTRSMPGGCTGGCGAGLVDAGKVLSSMGY